MKFSCSIFILAILCFTSAMAQNPSGPLAVGEAIPKFTLKNQNGETFNISDEIGKHTLVIYFYPKDESMVCTKEACAFRDSFNDYTKAGAQVIGINGGTVQSHKLFEEHYKLPFILLSDPGNKVLRKFGVKNKFFMTGRQTFVVDLKGKVAFSYESMLEGSGHSKQALAVIKALQSK